MVFRDALGRRLAPLYLSTFFGGLALWVPIEKLFMTQIGFTSASVGLMAAVYAVVVPVLEIPSGVLADRWSRRGVLILATLAVIVSVIIGGFSQSVTAYIVAAAFLGVFFALQTGTLESIVYDAVLEETGDSEAFERTMGRVRLIESAALVASALAGGLIAQFAPLRATYFLTAPLLALSAVMLLWLREPQLHRAEERDSLRGQIQATVRAVLGGGHLRAIIALTVVGALLMQGMLEFGPLWLVALLVPPFLYGPHWAGLTSALGLGAVLGARRWFTREWTVRVFAVAVVACCVLLVVSDHAVLVIGVQVALMLLVVAVSIPVTRRLHDAVPSTIRAGVASGVGTLTWLAFVPFAVVFGVVSQAAGLDRGAWLFVAIGVITALLMLFVLPRARPAVAQAGLEGAAAALPSMAIQPAFPPDRFLPPDDPAWPGHWANPPSAWAGSGLPTDSPEALEEVRSALIDLPAEARQVIVLRDVEGRSPKDVEDALGLSAERERALLHHARGQVRGRLERHFQRAEGAS
ncbi:MAG TPA: MFS transporter [Candidatus Limnocylindria bacterium]|jgi:predicted MFS family arabinose efflux permease